MNDLSRTLLALAWSSSLLLMACDPVPAETPDAADTPERTDPPDRAGLPDRTGPPDPPDPMTPPVGRLGILSIESGESPESPGPWVHAAVVAVNATTAERDGTGKASLAALLDTSGDRCWPRESADAPIAPLSAASFGESLIIDAPGGTRATLRRYDGDGFTGYAAAGRDIGSERLSGATLSISGDPRPRAMGITLPDAADPPTATLSELPAELPAEPALPRPDAGNARSRTLSWSPVARAPAAVPDARNRIVIELTIGGTPWRCEVDDDGELALDAALLAPAQDATDASVRVQRIARLTRTIYPLGDDLLLLRRLSNGSFAR